MNLSTMIFIAIMLMTSCCLSEGSQSIVVTKFMPLNTNETDEGVHLKPEAEMRCARACVRQGCCHFAVKEDEDGTCMIELDEALPADEPITRFYRDEELLDDDVTFVLRQDNSTDFQRPWSDYKRGFGDVTNFWLGLDKLHELTKCEGYGVRATMTDWGNIELSAYYNKFQVGSESSNYQLTVGEYDSLLSSVRDSLSYHNGMGFSTFDHDNDLSPHNCAMLYPGGWWSKTCHYVKPTGQYLLWGEVSMSGINWVNNQHSSYYSFKTMRLALVKRK